MIIVLLQTAILWGNEMEKMLQVDTHATLTQQCNAGDGNGCEHVCSQVISGASFSGYVALAVWAVLAVPIDATCIRTRTPALAPHSGPCVLPCNAVVPVFTQVHADLHAGP